MSKTANEKKWRKRPQRSGLLHISSIFECFRHHFASVFIVLCLSPQFHSFFFSITVAFALPLSLSCLLFGICAVRRFKNLRFAFLCCPCRYHSDFIACYELFGTELHPISTNTKIIDVGKHRNFTIFCFTVEYYFFLIFFFFRSVKTTTKAQTHFQHSVCSITT